MIQQRDTTTYLLLEGHQGREAADGWQRLKAQSIQITAEGIRLAPRPSPPTPLTDAAGTFGGLEYPTGVAVAPDGAIYLSDRQKHAIFKVVRREGWQVWAHYFLVGNNRYVYVPTANRLERWPGAMGTPADFADVEVLCENVWHASQIVRHSHSGACRLVVQDVDAEIDKKWDAQYPAQFPAGDVCQTTLQYLPCLGGLGSEPRQFNEPRGLAISRDNTLYVADTHNHRIQVFALRGLVLKAIWGRRPAPQAGNAAGEFNAPWDVAVDPSGNVYIADTGNSRLQKYDCRTKRFTAIDGTVLRAHFFQALYGPEAGARFVFIPRHRRVERWLPDGSIQRLSQMVDSLEAADRLIRETIGAVGAKDFFVAWAADYPHQTDPRFERPTHLALDAAGRLYVVDEAKDYVKILDSDGRVLEHVRYAEEVSDAWQPTAIAVDAEGTLVLADRAGMYRFHRDTGRYYCASGKAMRHHHCEGMAIDAKGHLITAGSESGSLVSIQPNGEFETHGVLYSQPLDSRIDQCQWHQIHLDFGAGIPPGTSVTVWTYTANDKRPSAEILTLDVRDWLTGQTNAEDFLILSPPGRYLWLKIEFRGNGVETPVLRHVQVFFPRLTYMEYLPAVYQAELVSKDFLERFLSIFDAIFSGIEGKIEQMAQYFDPYGVPSAPGKDFLAWLATWIDMMLDPRWPLAIRRQLLEKAPELYRQRGTVTGLKKLLQLALGVDVQVLEHFQLRRWLFLSRQSTLGGDSQLWGNGIVSRLQLEEHSRIGDFALVGTGDPQRDPFHVYAHKFSVFVPASRCRSELDERKIRSLIDSEKPAHTEYTLCSVEARFRVGMQSTVGFDTVVGAYPRFVLNRSATLGYDTLLGRAPEEEGPPTIKVGERSRVGVNVVVG